MEKEKNEKLKKLDKICSKSKMTMKGAVKIGKTINASAWKKIKSSQNLQLTENAVGKKNGIIFCSFQII